MIGVILRVNIYVIFVFVLTLFSAFKVHAQTTATELKTFENVTLMEKPEEVNKEEKKKPLHKKPSVQRDKPKTVESDTTKRKGDRKKTMVYLEQTDILMFDEEQFPDAQILIGNVVMRHDSAYLYCDTAHFFQNKNSFYAFGNVRMEQGDSLEAYSDKLYYYGDNKLAELRYNVHLINGEVELFTDSLNYNRNTNVGYYFTGGMLRDSLNTLNSVKGYYYSDDKLADFKDSVVVNNVDFVLTSDTLKYNTESKVATIVGPTTILYQEETTIYSELGFYNTESQRSHLKKNSSITQPDGKTLIGDTIIYDQKAGMGRAYNNVEIIDTANNVSLWGNFGFYIEDGEKGMVTDSAVMVEYSSEDTLYVNADTLYSYAQDTNKVVLGYKNVRIYRNDMQGVCDTMRFNSVDTVLRMISLPVLWSDNNQMTGDTINIHISGEELEKIHVINNAFLAQEEDTAHYNQMSGREIYCYIKDSTLRRVDVIGNSESIFFPKDSTTFIGMNTIVSTYTNVYFNEGQMERMVVYPAPQAKMLKLSGLSKEQKFLMNFTWVEYLRPKRKEDIFLRPQKAKVIEDREVNKEIQKQKDREKREREREQKLQEIKKAY